MFFLRLFLWCDKQGDKVSEWSRVREREDDGDDEGEIKLNMYLYLANDDIIFIRVDL